jgi:hypothetical protein
MFGKATLPLRAPLIAFFVMALHLSEPDAGPHVDIDPVVCVHRFAYGQHVLREPA